MGVGDGACSDQVCEGEREVKEYWSKKSNLWEGSNTGVEPRGSEDCLPGYEFVRRHKKDDGTFVHATCRKAKKVTKSSKLIIPHIYEMGKEESSIEYEESQE